MNGEELINQSRRIIQLCEEDSFIGYTEAVEFLRVFSGDKSSFYKSILNYRTSENEYRRRRTMAILYAFINYIENGLMADVSIERKAQIDVVSDFLDQANTLLETKNVHPATATVLIGASLEEFLRNWVDDSGLSIGNQKKGIDSYAKTLKKSNLIDTQDMKDITAWAGLRNHAAHGHWDEVKNKNKISLMLQGVNLFMRKHSQ